MAEPLGARGPRIDRDAVFEAVKRRLRRHRQLQPLRRVLAAGAIVAAGAIAISLREPPRIIKAPARPAPIAREAAPATARADWLAIAQAPDTRMTTRATPRGVDILLDAGGLAAEVRPGSGKTLRVETPSADIVVVGTTLAVRISGDATEVGVGEGRVLVRARGGAARAVSAGERVSVGREVSPLTDDREVAALLASLPGRWHPRASAPTAASEKAGDAAARVEAPGSAQPRLGGRGCDSAAEAAAIADRADAPRAARRQALELLVDCAAGAERARRLEALVALVPGHPVAWLELGQLRERAGDPTGARLAYSRHLEVAGGGPLADEARLALCRVSWDRSACLERFLAERPASDRRQEAEEQLRRLR